MQTLAEWETQHQKPNISEQEAREARLPHQSGDDYSFGGAAIVTIGDRAIMVGEGDGSFELAREIARRWNMHR
jgi:uncharacterized protein (UPF0548 family)